MTARLWNRLGSVAGFGYIAVSIVAALVTGMRPPPESSSAAIRDFFINERTALVVQGWLYALGSVLLLWFALAVRSVLRTASSDSHLGEVFFAGTVVVAGLSLVAMAIQIVVVKAASRVSPEAVRVVGYDFVLAQFLLAGFIVATTAIAYAGCVVRSGVLPRWTAWVAVMAAVLNLAGTLAVLVPDGAFSINGSVVVWLPGVSTVVWYLSAAVSLLRLGRQPASASAADVGS